MTIDGRENQLVPDRVDDSLLYLLHLAEISEPIFARKYDDNPPPYDKPYYTLCFEFVTDDKELWRSIADLLPHTVPFLGGDQGDDANGNSQD